MHGSLDCTAWTTRTYMNAKMYPSYRPKLAEMRRVSLLLVRRFIRLSEKILRAGGDVSFEWPRWAVGWRIPELKEFFERWNFKFGCFDGCRVGLVFPEGKIRKPWKFATTNPELAQELDKYRCICKKKHIKCEGARTAASAYYPKRMCKIVMDQVVKHTIKIEPAAAAKAESESAGPSPSAPDKIESAGPSPAAPVENEVEIPKWDPYELPQVYRGWEDYWADKDGSISRQELAKSGKFNNQEVDAMFILGDVNGDGDIDLEEFIGLLCPTATEALNKMTKSVRNLNEAQQLFKILDKDGDGSISMEEMRNCGQQFSAKEIDAIFALGDVNNDGEIDVNEFVAVMWWCVECWYYSTRTKAITTARAAATTRAA